MEEPEHTRRLLRESVDYSAVHRKEPTEEEEEEESKSHATPPRRQSFWRNRPWWQWLVLLQFANISFFLLWENRNSITHRTAQARDPIASSYWDLFATKTNFEYLGIREGYWTRLTNQTYWKYILTPKNGIVMINNAHLPALHQTLAARPTEPPLLPAGSEGSSLYQVAVFHSLHCLQMISNRLLDPMGFTPTDCSGLEFGFDEEDGFNQTVQTACHIQHCVDWIRQDVMCLADPTLEPFVIAESRRFKAEYHQCRNFEGVRDWAVRNEWTGSMSALQDFN